MTLGVLHLATTIHTRANGGNERLEVGHGRFASVERVGATTSDRGGIFVGKWVAVRFFERLAGASRGLAEHFRRSKGARGEALLQRWQWLGVVIGASVKGIEIFAPDTLSVLLF